MSKQIANLSNMGSRKVEQGDIGRNVAAQVRLWRQQKRLSHQELSTRLKQIGRPIVPSGISKIESGDRRVDVDDLVALAIALEVNPTRLLRPPEAVPEGMTEVELNKAAEAAWVAWDRAFALTHAQVQAREAGTDG
jgi:transcriptional regulator with XRE-family HTH domain